MTRYGDEVVLRSSNGGEYRRNMQRINPFNIPDERAVSQSELGSASATVASASAIQVMAPVTPITAPAPAERDSKDVFTTSNSGNAPRGASFGCGTATPSKEI